MYTKACIILNVQFRESSQAEPTQVTHTGPGHRILTAAPIPCFLGEHFVKLIIAIYFFRCVLGEIYTYSQSG